MKKILTIALIAAAAMFAISCDKEAEESEESDDSNITMTTATFTRLDGNGTLAEFKARADLHGDETFYHGIYMASSGLKMGENPREAESGSGYLCMIGVYTLIADLVSYTGTGLTEDPSQPKAGSYPMNVSEPSGKSYGIGSVSRVKDGETVAMGHFASGTLTLAYPSAGKISVTLKANVEFQAESESGDSTTKEMTFKYEGDYQMTWPFRY